MQYTLPLLEYPYMALEPFIDAQTMELHHKKHHQAYIDKLNAALETHPEITLPIEELLKDPSLVPEDIRQAVQNNGGGYVNHSFFWQVLSPTAKKAPEGMLRTAIETQFGSIEECKKKFEESAIGRFGSGWAWISVDPKGMLHIHNTPNQDSPFTQGLKPILGIDVWEHAYYLTYQNRRADYVQALWNVLDWKKAESLFELHTT